MSKSLDRLALLATFTRIAERGSISAAARDLSLSQASASRQLAELERRLGATLIHRTTHALSLTEVGEDCLIEARGLLDGWDALAERYTETGTGLHGRLKVVAPVALGQLHLAEAMLRFQQANLGLSITWLLQDGPIRFAEIGCDLWIKIGRVPDESLVVRPLGQVERMLVASPSLAGGLRLQRPSDLSELPCAALEPFEAGRIPLSSRDGETVTLAARIALSTDNIFAAYSAVRMGLGYAVLPRWLVEADLESGALLDLLPAWRAPALTINAAYRPMRRQTRRLQLFLEHTAAAVAAIAGIATS
ncbi:LysR family transcriptional regulator [Algihabitans albus]|uniref:LysR family transcriptional regulator n=1 Tax=Algihabitans albus TaxID=2164067 RepID=UPI000E5D54D4|nr:LysR family transcriptional regulator [Algihabitans albus]